MTGSDIIAIVAIVVSGAVSIITLIVNMRINKESIQAKRSELALEKRLDAFANICSAMSSLDDEIGFLAVAFSDAYKDESDNVISDQIIDDDSPIGQRITAIYMKHKHYTETYYKNRVYLPPELDAIFQDYWVGVLVYFEPNYISRQIRTTDISRWIKEIGNLDRFREQAVTEMHKFIGFK